MTDDTDLTAAELGALLDAGTPVEIVTDRYAAMTWPFSGPCPTCGLKANGIAAYRPTDGKAIPDEVVERHLAFSDKRTPDGGAIK